MHFELILDYSAARKCRGDPLRLAVKFLNRVLNEAVSALIPEEPNPTLESELYF